MRRKPPANRYSLDLPLPRQSFTRQLVLKKMKQLLRLNQIRSKHAVSVEATVRALLVAWVLQERAVADLRARLPTETSMASTPVSSWLVVGLGLDTLRQQVQGTWSVARLHLCLPRLRRFLISSPRRRVHQETAVREWLEQHVHSNRQRQVA